jgi:hypothetical protein
MKKPSYDFYLILATAAVLFVISAICVYGMFYFKLAQIHQMEPAAKMAYMNGMNAVIAPFLITLILLLGICIPKRLLPTKWLNIFSGFLLVSSILVGLLWKVQTALLWVLFISLTLQLVVLIMAIAGSETLHFEKKGYWVRVGSSLIHLGLVLFVLDLFYYQQQTLHLVLFWITTITTTLGMLFCFYAESVVKLLPKNPTLQQQE